MLPRRPRDGDNLWCSRGEHFVPLDGFSPKVGAPAWKDGTPAMMSWCKECMAAYQKQRHADARQEALCKPLIEPYGAWRNYR